MRFFGKIINGEKKYYRPLQYSEYLKSMEGKEFSDTTELREENITKDQRGYFRASIKWLIDNTESFGGHSEEELYEDILNELTGYTKAVEWKGEIVEKRFYKRTSGMNKKEMSKLIDDFINWLAHDGVYIPTPEEAIIGKYATVKEQPTKKEKGIKLIISEEERDLQQEF